MAWRGLDRGPRLPAGADAAPRNAMTPSGVAAAGGDKVYLRGTHRACPPAQTWERLQPLLVQAGITRLANITGLDRLGLPVFTAYRPNARSLAVYQGKGLELMAAKVSAAMEALEAYFAEQITGPLLWSSAVEMPPVRAVVDISRLPRARGRSVGDQHALLWIAGYDLPDGGELWLPYELVHCDYRLSQAPGSGRFLASSNGLASGNTRTEALCHALCEVIERDAITRWRRDPAMQRGGRLDLATVDDRDCRAVLKRFAEAAIDVAIWETTSAVGLPVFFCLLAEAEGQSDQARPADGMGCHLVREIALLRALTEAAQGRLTYIAGARDDLMTREYSAVEREQTLARCRALMRAQSPVCSFAEVPTFPSTRFSTDLDCVLQRLRASGIHQVAAIDLAPAAAPIAVVRVVVPGLQGPDEHPDFSPLDPQQR